MENDADKEVSSRDVTFSCEDETPETSNGFICEETTNLVKNSEPITQNEAPLLQMSSCVEWIEPDMDLQELERELRVIEEECERNKIMWTPWGIVDELLLDPQEFASVMRDIEAQEEYERIVCLSQYYDSEDEEKGYTCECRRYWDDDLAGRHAQMRNVHLRISGGRMKFLVNEQPLICV